VIDKNILIEDLVTRLPRAVGYLMKKNIKCLACGEPIWGTLEDAARQKGFSDEEIDVFVRQLNALAVQDGGRGPERD
jgi:iron-sulfur cluster repair protein YtfE (RIC family)